MKTLLALLMVVLCACSGSVEVQEPVQEASAPLTTCVTPVFGAYTCQTANVTWGAYRDDDCTGCQTGDLCQVYLGANFLANGVCQ